MQPVVSAMYTASASVTHGSSRRPIQIKNKTMVKPPSAAPPAGAYEASYWRSVWAMALREVPDHTTRHARAPKVYVYSLPKPWSDLDITTATAEDCFGTQLLASGPVARGDTPSWVLRDATYGVSASYAFASMLHYRLWHSRTYRTNDPAEADLFFVPALTRPKRAFMIKAACAAAANATKPLEAHLEHLTPATAPRHFFAAAYTHEAWESCTGWFSNPSPLLERAIRLSYSAVQPVPTGPGLDDAYHKLIGHRIAYQPRMRFPNLVAVPYPASLHMAGHARGAGVGAGWQRKGDERNASAPWENRPARRALMLFVGNAQHGDSQVRKLIAKQCKAFRPPTCENKGYAYGKGLFAKQQADFCLEPGGDSPYRKSLADDISMGCIPVLFHPMTDNANEWLWATWKHSGRLLVDRAAFLRGEVNLHRLLSSAPPPLVQRMKATVRRHARVFTISMQDDPGDSIHAILVGASRLAADLVASNLTFVDRAPMSTLP